MKKSSKSVKGLPRGFSLSRIEEIRKHYDRQSDPEAARADDLAANGTSEMIAIPSELVPVVRDLVQVFKAKSRPRKLAVA